MRSWWSRSGSPAGAADPATLVRRFVEASRRAEIVALVNSARDDREVAQVVVDELCEALEAEIAFIVVTRPEEGARETIGQTGLTPAETAAVSADPLCRAALGARAAVVHRGADLLRVGAHHLVLSPWTAESGRQAVIGVARLYEEPFDAAEVALLEGVTASVGHALERSWLSADRDRHAARQSALARAAKTLSASLIAEEVLRTLSSEVLEALDADVAVVYGVEENGLRVVAAAGMPAEALADPGEDTFPGRTARDGAPRTCQPFEPGCALAPPDRPPLRSGLAAPIRTHGTVTGVVLAGYHGDRWVERGDVELLAAFAELAAVVGRNAADHAAARRAASLDGLTGCLNHGAFQDRLREELSRAARSGTTLALALIDLDDFKLVNDTYGHLAGDAYLRGVAEGLRGSVRPYDQVARYGGDEFALLLPATDEATGRCVLARALAAVRRVPLAGDARASGSGGIAEWRPGDGPERVIARADEDLLDAKARRRRGATGESRRAGGPRFARAPAGREPRDELERTHVQTSAALAGAIESHDERGGEHAHAVADFAVAIGRELGMDADELRELRDGALLHDVGKVAVPDAILNTPRTLNGDERAVIRAHPLVGDRILAAVPALAGARRIIRHAHERWDGLGYPDGLLREAIPRGARVVLVAEAYHAMLAERPYRRARSAQLACAALRRNAGTQFDPRVVDAALRVLARNGAG